MAVFVMWATDVREFVSLDGYYRARLVDMIRGTAHRPFVLRALIPQSGRIITGLLPQVSQDYLRQTVYESVPWVERAVSYVGWQREYLPEYLITLCLAYLAFLGFMYVLRRLVKVLYDTDGWLRDLLPVLAVLVLPVFFKRGTHLIYDFPSLFFFSLGLYLLHRCNWRWYYLVLLVGGLNKETMVLLTVVFAFGFYSKMPRRDFVFHVLAQLSIFGVTRIVLGLLFSASLGGVVELHLWENVRLYLRPYWYGAVWDIVGVFLLVGYRFKEKPQFLRRSLVIAAPLMALFFVFGGYGEIRALYEVCPIAFLLGFQTVAIVMGWRCTARPDQVWRRSAPPARYQA